MPQSKLEHDGLPYVSYGNQPLQPIFSVIQERTTYLFVLDILSGVINVTFYFLTFSSLKSASIVLSNLGVSIMRCFLFYMKLGFFYGTIWFHMWWVVPSWGFINWLILGRLPSSRWIIGMFWPSGIDAVYTYSLPQDRCGLIHALLEKPDEDIFKSSHVYFPSSHKIYNPALPQTNQGFHRLRGAADTVGRSL